MHSIVAPSAPPLSHAAAREIAGIARKSGGLSISSDKVDFIAMRVGRRLRDIGCHGYDDYLCILRGPEGANETRRLVEALATHTTSFFREKAHYDWLAGEGLSAMTAQGAGRERPLVFWSAACSLGSEMWTAAMVIDRFARSHRGLRWEVVGTDVSRRILRRAAIAAFTQDEIAGLPEDWRRDYLLRRKKMGPGLTPFRIAPELRARARFACANLVTLDPAPKVTADVAFLRNVLIYFSPTDQRRAVEAVVARLAPGGWLVTGHAESLVDPPPGLRQTATSIYRKE